MTSWQGGADLTKNGTVQEYAREGQRPIPEHDTVDAIYTVVYNTGIFIDDCNDWDDKDSAFKSWASFKQHFNAAQLKARRRQKATSKMGGFHGANSIHHQEQQSQLDNAESALINMITSAAEDREQVKQKDKIVADQVLLINALTPQLSAANSRIIALQASKQTSRHSLPTSTISSPPTTSTHASTQSLQSPHQAYQGASRNPTTKRASTSPLWVNGKHKKDKGVYCWAQQPSSP